MPEWTFEQWETMLSNISGSDNLKGMLKDWKASIIKLELPWISVEDNCPDTNREVEIAFWDGSYMCRIHGGYDDGEWWIGDKPWNSDDCFGPEYPVTHWKEAAILPNPPEE
jgi:hypothetical protein